VGRDSGVGAATVGDGAWLVEEGVDADGVVAAAALPALKRNDPGVAVAAQATKTDATAAAALPAQDGAAAAAFPHRPAVAPAATVASRVVAVAVAGQGRDASLAVAQTVVVAPCSVGGLPAVPAVMDTVAAAIRARAACVGYVGVAPAAVLPGNVCAPLVVVVEVAGTAPAAALPEKGVVARAVVVVVDTAAAVLVGVADVVAASAAARSLECDGDVVAVHEVVAALGDDQVAGLASAQSVGGYGGDVPATAAVLWVLNLGYFGEEAAGEVAAAAELAEEGSPGVAAHPAVASGRAHDGIVPAVADQLEVVAAAALVEEGSGGVAASQAAGKVAVDAAAAAAAPPAEA
jgi:hypothetical protein